MKRAVVIRHLAFEDLGTLAPRLVAAGYEIEMVEAGLDDLGPALSRACDLLVVLGGPISVNDGEDFRFIDEERDVLRGRLERDEATLGICLGAQLMASALGEAVYPGTVKEIGWAPLQLTREGRDHPLRHLDEQTPTFHWHGETFDLPPSARLLASTPACAQQAFSYRRRGLALQFHPEVTAASLERWYIGHAVELAAAGRRVADLRREAALHAAVHELRAARFLTDWLAFLPR